jgi:hypothetical protein
MSYLIECPTCEAMMGTEIKGQVVEGPEDDGPPFATRISLCECPKCHGALVGVEMEDTPYEGDFDAPTRVWPSPRKYISFKIPVAIRQSLNEAEKCLRGKAYTATVGMCGRALEATGRHFYPSTSDKSKPLMLKQAIDKLAADKIIDGRLHKWGIALQGERNLAFHPSGTDFKKQDALDVFKFATNICEYIFVLTAEFDEYEKRRQARTKPK